MTVESTKYHGHRSPLVIAGAVVAVVGNRHQGCLDNAES